MDNEDYVSLQEIKILLRSPGGGSTKLSAEGWIASRQADSERGSVSQNELGGMEPSG